MNAVVFAYHDMGLAGLEALKRSGFRIAAVFSHRDAPGERIWFGSVVNWTGKNGIPCFCPEKVNAPEWVERIRSFYPDVIFSFYYRNLLGADLLKIPPSGAYNLHGSLLPAYRGRCPVNWVLINGEQRTGVTLHHMIEKADAGDIVGQKEIPIAPDDTALTLFGKLCAGAGELLDEVLPLIKNGTAPRIPQDPALASYFGGRKPEDGLIDWSWPAERIYNLIRAVTEPYPGAFTRLPEGRLMIWWASPERDAGQGPAGAVEIEGDSVYIRASAGRLKLLDIETDGLRMKGRQILDYFKNRKGVILR